MLYPTCNLTSRDSVANTEFQLARLIHHISLAPDSGRTVTACFFDLWKAFDRVWHQGLPAKLAHYGVSARVHAWLKEYLTSRRQHVQIEGYTSTFVDISAGVPRVYARSTAVLIYTIDLPLACEWVQAVCWQFADDTALVTVGKSIAECEEALHRAVWSTGVWLKQWHLLVNTNKTVIMHFYNDNRPQNTLPTITLDGKRLDTVTLWHHFSTQPTLDTSHGACLKKNIQIIKILIFYFACDRHYITARSPQSIQLTFYPYSNMLSLLWPLCPQQPLTAGKEFNGRLQKCAFACPSTQILIIVSYSIAVIGTQSSHGVNLNIILLCSHMQFTICMRPLICLAYHFQPTCVQPPT